MPQCTGSAATVLLTEVLPFLNEIRRVLRLKHMIHRTEASYLRYILGFLRFHDKQHPKEMARKRFEVANRVKLPQPLPLPETVTVSIIRCGLQHE